MLLVQRCTVRVHGAFVWNKPAACAIAFMHDHTKHNDGGGNHAAATSLGGTPTTENRNNKEDDDDDIVLPYREYGYRSEPLTWDELIQIVDKEDNLAKLSRSVEQQKEYIISTREIKRRWRSVYDHILHSKFGFEKRVVESDAQGPVLWETYPPVSEIKDPRKVLVLNDFPYYNAPGIYHYVLWKIGGNVTDLEIEEAREELCSNLGDVEDLLHWKNPPHLKSLPDIDHIHILCRRKLPLSEDTGTRTPTS